MNEITLNVNPQIYQPGDIVTFTGKIFSVVKPDPELICIEDIAHALSQLCRWGGHTKEFYSVAEHCVRCSTVISKEHKLAALLHDASEAYIVDLPSPIKMMMPEYVDAEDRLMKAIAQKFGFEYPLHLEVKKIDRKWLYAEWENVIKTCNWTTYLPYKAEELFLQSFHELTK